MTLYDAVRRAARGGPGRCAVEETGGGSATYAGLLDLADRMAGGLAARGVRAGDCVAFGLRGGIPYVALVLGVAKLGARYVPLLAGFGDREVAEALRRTRPVLLVADRAVAAPGLPAVSPKLLAEPGPAAAAPDGEGGADRAPQAGVFRILWSSGSTGFPKGIAWRQDAFVAERRRWLADTGIRDTDVFFCRHPLDVAHATDLHVFAALLAGGRVVLADPAAPPAVLLRQIASHRATAMSALPRHYEELAAAAAPGTALPLMRRALCGGAYVGAGTVRRVRSALGAVLHEVYGSTEFGLALGDIDGRGLVPVAGVGARIEALAGSPGTGELVLRSDCTSEGYPDDAAAGRRTWRGGEFWTGDVATRTHDGGFRILGRLSEALATPAGPLLAPVLDEEITATGAVAEAVALPRRTDGLGSEVVVAVRPEGGGAEAVAAARTVLLRHGLRGSVACVDAVPRTEVGKVDKPLLRARWGLR
ncbi:class I adenylate-forming enzyme family protein [Streptomyces globosus]|uniref:class I adenylate-forming enzyme family protein n=1 Tax=Streptomyces globosus TaxID=68209 RepID=UPI0031E2D334